MKRTLKFISSLLLCVSLQCIAQQKPIADTATVPKPKTERYGIRIGADLSRLARSLYDDNFRGIELVADYRLTKKIYFAGEVGNTKFTVDDDQVNFTTSGSYLKAGFDYNAYDNWLDMENMIYVGVRYGFASFSQTLNSYNVYDDTGYFGQAVVYPGTEYKGLTAHWGEVVGGVKAEIFDNLYLGFSVRLNLLFTQKIPEGFDNLYIPGFNRTYAGSFGAGFNYSLSYFVPLYKKAKIKE